MRVEDWLDKLYEQIELAEQRVFAYGSFDCCLFPADVVAAITGVDYAAELRGYQSKIDAYRIVARYGSIEDMITALLEREPVHPSQAMRGDVVLASIPLVDGERGDSAGICLGTQCVFPKDVGLQRHPRAKVRLAWRIT